MQAPSGFHPDRTLERDDLHPDPLTQFRVWFDDADAEGLPLPNAMALATADAEGRPSVRHVLLRGVDERGFVFYTNHESHKGSDLDANPRAALVFLWKELDRQVTVSGRVERVSDEESDAYFASRPRDAQIGAWASPQSRPIPDRATLDHAVAEVDLRFEGRAVPRPSHWGGYRVMPDTVEFWHGRAFRLHDRFRFERDERAPTGWRIDRLAP
ncbi:MAG: pyridoxamine 5'-phosphate oxidase [Actinomycetota bacterium]